MSKFNLFDISFWIDIKGEFKLKANTFLLACCKNKI